MYCIAAGVSKVGKTWTKEQDHHQRPSMICRAILRCIVVLWLGGKPRVQRKLPAHSQDIEQHKNPLSVAFTETFTHWPKVAKTMQCFPNDSPFL
jgi:hypothetical protein